MPILSNPIKGLRDCPSPISSAKKRSYIIGKLIETDYFETGSTETICSACPIPVALARVMRSNVNPWICIYIGTVWRSISSKGIPRPLWENSLPVLCSSQFEEKELCFQVLAGELLYKAPWTDNSCPRSLLIQAFFWENFPYQLGGPRGFFLIR
jgi:hypothetical protein